MSESSGRHPAPSGLRRSRERSPDRLDTAGRVVADFESNALTGARSSSPTASRPGKIHLLPVSNVRVLTIWAVTAFRLSAEVLGAAVKH